MAMFGRYYFYLAILFIIIHLPSICETLFQDQIGKFDWRIKNVGCPGRTWFGRLEGNVPMLLIISTNSVIARIHTENGEIIWRQINEPPDGRQLQFCHIDKSFVVVHIGRNLRAFDVHTGTLIWQKHAKECPITGEKLHSEKGLSKSSFNSRTGELEILTEHGRKFKTLISDTGGTIAEVKVVNLNEEFNEIFIRREDCQLDYYTLNSKLNQLDHKWTRYEALAEVSDVLMIDPPLSEAQAQIETEFNVDESILRSFLLRIRAQFEQLRSLFIKVGSKLMEAADSLFRGEISYSSLFNEFTRFDEKHSGNLLERDYFNLRKIIIVSTLKGTLYGLSSDKARMIWTLPLGIYVRPYKSNGSARKIPLFLLRGTSFYQWESQAAVIFNRKDSANTMIVIFNPTTGEKINQLEVPGGLLRVEQWPFADSEQLNPLLILRKNQPNLPELWPVDNSKRRIEQPRSTFLMTVTEDTGILSGYQINLSEKHNSMVERWRTNLPGFSNGAEGNLFEAIVGKHINQKVHSQGKVLGDRAVLYKYINPNLVAILTSNRKELSLHLHLVDAVNGQLVYSGKYSRAHPPFHIVHCENWILVSYWNEKTRRTELGVVELYEGLRQTNSTAFDAFSPLRDQVQIMAQSYIFPQGISALTVTDTEQGLTSRSLLIALPFGGVLEMSRRFFDARRPLEMTPELREEMLIPYIPELPLTTEDLINYNQTVHNVHGIKAVPSGLESTTIVFVFGLDLFYTRIMPSGTFDILKDDFDYFFITLVIISLTVASYVCKGIWRYQSIQQAWA